MITEKHLFEADRSGKRCTKCYRSEAHENHQLATTIVKTSTDPDYPGMQANMTPIKRVEIIPSYDSDGKPNGTRTFDRTDAIEFTEPVLECQGHPCAKCHVEWKHEGSEILCGNRGGQGLCHDCAQQSAIIVNRSEVVKQIKDNSTSQMTPQEIVELDASHMDFAVMNLLRNSETGEKNPNWNERISAHIAYHLRKSQEHRIIATAAYKVKQAEWADEVLGLSPEDRAKRERQGAYNRGLKAEKAPKAPKQPKAPMPQAEAHKAFVKAAAARILAKNPGISKEELDRRAEAKAKRDEEDDE